MECWGTNPFIKLTPLDLKGSSDALLLENPVCANSPLPAICMVEISGAVRQGLSGFDRNNPKAIPNKDACFISKSTRCTDPAAKLWLG
jgi:hypothetical protein